MLQCFRSAGGRLKTDQALRNQRFLFISSQLLREKFARKTVGDEGIGSRHFPPHERETLVAELEESQQQVIMTDGDVERAE